MPTKPTHPADEPYPRKPNGKHVSKDKTPFSAFCAKGSSCQKETSFTESTLDAMWARVEKILPDVKYGKDTDRNKRSFYDYWKGLHLDPTVATFKATMGVDQKTWERNSLVIGECIAANDLNIIRWSNKNELDNHHYLFPHNCVGLVDGGPARIAQPSCLETHRVANSGKYRDTVLKFEAICSLKGKILSFEFPFNGNNNDAKIRKIVEPRTPLAKTERLLGDRAYKASKNVVTAYIKPANKKGQPPKFLTPAQKQFNKKYNQVRQRIEIVIGHIKNRPLFRRAFKGTMRNFYT